MDLRNKDGWPILITIAFILCLFPICGHAGRSRSSRRSSSGMDGTSMVQVISTNTRTGFVDMENALKLMPDSVDTTNAPDNIYHGAVVVFGQVYDFIADEGVVVSEEESYFRENVPLWDDGIFYTKKNKKEFLNWIEEQKQRKYTTASYDLVDNNCLTFVADAVHFLGGKEPDKLKNQKEFAIRNRSNVELLKGLAKAANMHPIQNPN